jgi:cytochrome c oxidase subunit 2
MTRRRLVVGTLAVLTAVALAGCSRRSPSMLDTHSPEGYRLSTLTWFLMITGGAVYVIVAGFVVTGLLRGRHHREARPQPRVEHRMLMAGGLVVPVIILATLAVVTVHTVDALRPAGADGVQITVTAEQWWWRIQYPADHIETSNEIHVPVGRPVSITLMSVDVVHSFWVPQLNGKTDVIPGQTNHLSFTATRAGEYRGQCAEFCGIAHAKMAFLVVADSPSDYAAWVSQHQTQGASPTSDLASKGRDLFVNSSCAGCHTVAGTQAVGTFGPNLTHIGSNRYIAAGTLPNTPESMAQWLAHTDDVKPGVKMPQIDLTNDQVQSLVAYLEELR